MRGRYRDRREAGRVLAKALADYAHRADALVLALPRGGAPVAYEVAKVLGVGLDLVVVRKLGVPGHEELAMGAIASGGAVVRNESVLEQLEISPQSFEEVRQREQRELARRESAYRGDRAPAELSGKTAILVDDGLATGATMLAVVKAARRQGARTVVAVPVAPTDTVERFEQIPEVEAIVCPWTPEPFLGVGRWYEDFQQVSDEQVRALLERAWAQGQGQG